MNELSDTKRRSFGFGSPEFHKCPHICAFFNGPDDEYRTLLPYIVEGLNCGEKAVHTVNPARRDDHLRRLTRAGIDVDAVRRSGQFELHDWTNTHLRGGQFDPEKTLALFTEVAKQAGVAGFPLIRFVTDMEWALESCPGVEDLLEYEAKANRIWMDNAGPVHPVICTYDLTKFRGDVVVDILRTHPLVIIAGTIQENPFFVPPGQFLEELRKRRLREII